MSPGSTFTVPVAWQPVSVFETIYMYCPGNDTLTLDDEVPLRKGLRSNTAALLGLNAAPMGYLVTRYLTPPVVDPVRLKLSMAKLLPQSKVVWATGLDITGGCVRSSTCMVPVRKHPL